MAPPINVTGKLGQLVQQKKTKKCHGDGRSNRAGARNITNLMQAADDLYDETNAEYCMVGWS